MLITGQLEKKKKVKCGALIQFIRVPPGRQIFAHQWAKLEGNISRLKTPLEKYFKLSTLDYAGAMMAFMSSL